MFPTSYPFHSHVSYGNMFLVHVCLSSSPCDDTMRTKNEVFAEVYFYFLNNICGYICNRNINISCHNYPIEKATRSQTDYKQ